MYVHIYFNFYIIYNFSFFISIFISYIYIYIFFSFLTLFCKTTSKNTIYFAYAFSKEIAIKFNYYTYIYIYWEREGAFLQRCTGSEGRGRRGGWCHIFRQMMLTPTYFIASFITNCEVPGPLLPFINWSTNKKRTLQTPNIYYEKYKKRV